MKSVHLLVVRSLWLIFTSLCLPVLSFAQATGDDVEMADIWRANGKIYVVISVLCVIFIGIVVYLLLIDRRLRKLENDRSKK